MRGFKCISEKDVELPKRSTKHAAGYDFFIPEDVVILPGDTEVIHSGVKAYMADDEVLKIYLRSSAAIKHGLKLVNQVGIIDSDYYDNPKNEGEILIAVKNHSDAPVTLTRGDRIAQGIFQKYLIAKGDEVATERQGGVGSTTPEDL